MIFSNSIKIKFNEDGLKSEVAFKFILVICMLMLDLPFCCNHATSTLNSPVIRRHHKQFGPTCCGLLNQQYERYQMLQQQIGRHT